MNWKSKYQGLKPGDKIMMTEDISYPDLIKGDICIVSAKKHWNNPKWVVINRLKNGKLDEHYFGVVAINGTNYKLI